MSEDTTNIFSGFWELNFVKTCWFGLHCTFSSSRFVVVSGRKVFRWCGPLSSFSAKLPQPWKALSLFFIFHFAFSFVFLYLDVLFKGISPESLRTLGILETGHTCRLMGFESTWAMAEGTWGLLPVERLPRLFYPSAKRKEHPGCESQHSLTCYLRPVPNNAEAEAWTEEMNILTESSWGFPDLPGLIPDPCTALTVVRALHVLPLYVSRPYLEEGTVTLLVSQLGNRGRAWPCNLT